MQKIILGLVAVVTISSIAYAEAGTIKDNGTINGVPSYQVTCPSGSTHIIYKKDGSWYTGSSGHMGDKFNSFSKQSVAGYLCR